MSWIKGKKRGQSVFAAAFVLLGIWAVVAVRGSAATANVVDGFVLNKTGTAVMSYEGDGGDIVDRCHLDNYGLFVLRCLFQGPDELP